MGTVLRKIYVCQRGPCEEALEGAGAQTQSNGSNTLGQIFILFTWVVTLYPASERRISYLWRVLSDIIVAGQNLRLAPTVVNQINKFSTLKKRFEEPALIYSLINLDKSIL